MSLSVLRFFVGFLAHVVCAVIHFRPQNNKKKKKKKKREEKKRGREEGVPLSSRARFSIITLSLCTSRARNIFYAALLKKKERKKERKKKKEKR